MKKLFLALTFCIILAFLCSCQNQKYGILKYQDEKINAECTLNGEYRISIKKDGDKKEISFLEPASLSHISFAIDGESIIGRVGELEIPLEYTNARGIFALSNIFSLSEECLCTATSQGSCSSLEFRTDYGVYTLTLGKNNLPNTIQIYSTDYRYDISIDAITIS